MNYFETLVTSNPDKNSMRRQKYFDELLEMFTEHIEARDARTESELQEKILSFIEKNDVPEEDGDGYDPYLGDGVFADNH